MKVLIKDGKTVGEANAALKQTDQFRTIESDTQRYSLTPTTFDTRTYESDLDCWYFEDLYKHKDNHATRFGLNDRSQYLMQVVNAECKTVDVLTRPPSTIASSKYLPSDAKSIELCSLEKRLIDKAIKHLVHSNDRVIVVDILARVNGGDGNGDVKLIDEGIPEIHSVVLYLNPEAKNDSDAAESSVTNIISVIDPNNFYYSSHISNYSPSINEDRYKLATFHSNKVQIYKPLKGTKTGFGLDLSRDCIDIAIKIAMNLQTFSDYLLDESTIAKCLIVQCITNNPKLDGDIIVPKSFSRIKQASDYEVMSKFNRAQKELKKTLFMASKVIPEKHQELEKITFDLLSKSTCMDDIKALCLHHGKCVEDMKLSLSTNHNILVGDLGFILEGGYDGT